MNREIGFPISQQNIEESFDSLVGENQIHDRFNLKTLQLAPENSDFDYSLSQNFMSVLSKDEASKVYHLSLWSLESQNKLWDFKLGVNHGKHITSKVSDCGLVLVSYAHDVYSRENVIILFNGAQSGALPKLNWQSIDFIGQRIFGSYCEYDDFFLGEWTSEGQLLNRYELNRKDNMPLKHFENEGFWVRCITEWRRNFYKNATPPTIEIVNLTNKMIELVELPYGSQDDLRPLHIFKNKYIFSKTSNICSHKWDFRKRASICIFDLVSKKLEEFPTALSSEEDVRSLKRLTANQRYVAWLEKGTTICVKYLDLDSEEKKVQLAAETLPGSILKSLMPEKIDLSICGSALSIAYLKKGRNNGTYYFRKVVNLTNGELVQRIKYK